MKKFFAILLSAMLMLSLAVPSMAEGETPAKNNSITIKEANVDETYNLYKLFDLKVNNEITPTAYTYTVNEGWAAFFAQDGDGAQYVTVNAAGAVTAISAPAALAKAAAEWANKPATTQSIKATSETVVFENLADGYWLITSTLGTIAMTETTPDQSAVEITEKNPEDTITKEVQEDSQVGNEGDGWFESNDAQVGDTVNFRSTVKIVKGTRNVVVHDKMDSGLTYTPGSVAIAGLTKGTEYTVIESSDDKDTFDITFDQQWIDNLPFGDDGYEEFVITYSATLNEQAVVKSDDSGVAIDDQKNKTHVSFGDNTNSTEDSTTTTTHKFNVFKHATGSTGNLAGAVFQLKKNGAVVKLIKLDDNNYRIANGDEAGAVETFTTVSAGDIVIWGVDSDNDYTLKEITPPEGYNKLTEEVNVTWETGKETRIDVENKSGTELPSTGGMGTTIFYAVGGVMVAAAVVLLITKKRMSAEG